jgi:hypothetical protein
LREHYAIKGLNGGVIRVNSGSFFRTAGFWTFGRLSDDVNKTIGDSVMKIGKRVIAHLACGAFY